MHIKKIKKEIRNKVIAIITASVMVFGGFVSYKHQQNKISDLEEQLKMKQDIDNKNSGNYISIADIKSIEKEFNNLNSYTIFKGSMNLKHMYCYERDSVLGLKSRGQLTANATVLYEYKIDLVDADITVDYDKNTINITLPKPKLNEDSVKRKNNTFAIVKKESTNNILMNDKDGSLLQRYWEETFVESAKDKLNEYYEEKEDYLNSIARKEVLDLINTLGLNKTNVKINIK